MSFDRKTYFDAVRQSLFSGSMTTDQVEGQEAILGEWELQGQIVDAPPMTDLRWLAYMLATTYHETSTEMQPIEEYGKGEGKEYGVPDPETGYAYYGRGYVQLTWASNYQRATVKLGLQGDSDLYWHPDEALDPQIAADIMFVGMREGWFRASSDGKPQNLPRYFGETVDNAFEAREIINGDKNTVPKWSNGVSIGQLVKGYHQKFLAALEASLLPEPAPSPWLPPVLMDITVPEGVTFQLIINGEPFHWPP